MKRKITVKHDGETTTIEKDLSYLSQDEHGAVTVYAINRQRLLPKIAADVARECVGDAWIATSTTWAYGVQELFEDYGDDWERTRVTVSDGTGDGSVTVHLARDPSYAVAQRIRRIRTNRNQNQTEFGQDLADWSASTAQRKVSDLERGVSEPTAAMRKTLQRMDEGTL